MGYYSDVYIKIDKSQLIPFQAMLDKHDVDWYEEVVQDSDEYLKVYFCNVKWYKGRATIDDIQEFIETTPNCGAISIGEDNAVEYYGDYDKVGLEVTCTIEGF